MHRISHLTGLRAVAAIIVFLSHSANEGIIPSVFGVGFGQVGVMIFFVLSGFLMGFLYLHEYPSSRTIYRFLVSRVARIFPLYIFLIIFSFFIVKIYSEYYYKIDISELVVALLFIKAPQTFWTIPVEVQFYGLFMVTWLIFYRFGVYSILLICFLVSVLVPLVYLSGFGLPNILPKYAFAFFVGIFIAYYREEIKSYCSFFNYFGVVFLIFIFLNLPVLRGNLDLHLFSHVNGFYFNTWLDPFSWLLVIGLFISCVCASNSLNFLNNRLFDYLGKVSYGFYLVHYPVIYFFMRLELEWYLQFSLSFSVAFVIAALLYNYFEIPSKNFISRLMLKNKN